MSISSFINLSYIFAPILLLSSIAQASCDRTQRTQTYYGEAIKVYASEEQWAEVVIPERIIGRLIETPENITYKVTPTFSDRFYVQTQGESYYGTIFIHGESGSTYHIKVLSRLGCADSTVTIKKSHDDDISDDGNLSQSTRSNSSKSDKSNPPKLINIMMSGGEPPRGYRKVIPNGGEKEQLVYRQGSISFYLRETWVGRKQNGLILEAINEGRTPFRVAIEAINFTSAEVRKALGRPREASMMPSDMRLGPAPEYAVDLYKPTNKGLIFIVTRAEGNHGR
jgi:hypothetical protein